MRIERRRLGRPLLLALALAPLAQAAPREVPLRIERIEQEYHLDAADWPTLIRRIEQGRALDGREPRSHGSTAISLESRYEMLQRDRRCEVGGLEVRLELKRRTPRWDAPDRVSPRMRARWERARRALVTHEQGHEALAERAARRLVAALAALPETADCAVWRRQVQREDLRALIWLQGRSNSYDQHTRHGAAQGATLRREVPPRVDVDGG